MGSLLDAANVSVKANTDKFILGELPVSLGDVSIMTIEQAYIVLGGSVNSHELVYDLTKGYKTSTYYVYAINDSHSLDSGNNDAIINSTLENLHAVGLNWYQQLNKPVTPMKHWTVSNHDVFGGPLGHVCCHGDDGYDFGWYYSKYSGIHSGYSYYWNDYVPGTVYVAIVRAK